MYFYRLQTVLLSVALVFLCGRLQFSRERARERARERKRKLSIWLLLFRVAPNNSFRSAGSCRMYGSRASVKSACATLAAHRLRCVSLRRLATESFTEHILAKSRSCQQLPTEHGRYRPCGVTWGRCGDVSLGSLEFCAVGDALTGSVWGLNRARAGAETSSTPFHTRTHAPTPDNNKDKRNTMPFLFPR